MLDEMKSDQLEQMSLTEQTAQNARTMRTLRVLAVEEGALVCLDPEDQSQVILTVPKNRGRKARAFWPGDRVRVPGDNPAGLPEVLPRENLARGPVAGLGDDGGLSNVTRVFVCSPAGRDWNGARTARLIDWSWSLGVPPVLVLCGGPDTGGREDVLREIEELSIGLDVIDLAGDDPAPLGDRTGSADTVLLVGETASLLDRLCSAVLEDDHRASRPSHRLVPVWGGTLLYVPPREAAVRLDGDGEGESDSDDFARIGNLAVQCRYADCTHGPEPGCAVRLAVEEGRLPSGALALYRSQLGQEEPGDDRRQDEEEDRFQGRRKKTVRDREDNRKAKGWLRRQD